ncbi:MAG: hypothetical protein AseanaTS_04080 [Candidatus Pelagadaptatus aseana]|uniref:hypothetical protein n=1 Tax=Candidatus Pelagadaptatus aseana TaxID=3120508 RepID=UPI0039B1352E
MKKLLLASAILSLSHAALADRTAIGDDGREIRLKENGSWEYISNDRFATSEDGTRVRLKDDGSWEFIGNAPMQTEEQVRTENLDLTLDRVITEYIKEKSGPKNYQYKSQTVFYLDLDVSSYGAEVQSKLNQFDLIKAVDDKNTEYPVIAVTPSATVFKSGQKYKLAIRVDGSPAGSIVWGTRKLYLKFDPAVFGNGSELSFMIRTNEIKKAQVKKLPK